MFGRRKSAQDGDIKYYSQSLNGIVGGYDGGVVDADNHGGNVDAIKGVGGDNVSTGTTCTFATATVAAVGHGTRMVWAEGCVVCDDMDGGDDGAGDIGIGLREL